MITKRIVAKTLTWKSIGIVVIFFLSLLITGDVQVSGTLSITQIAASTMLYMIHEWGWSKVAWGKE